MIATGDKLRALGRTVPASELLAASATLTLPQAELQASVASACHVAIQGGAHDEVLQQFCVEIGRRIDSPLVMLCRKAANGIVAIEAASSDNALSLAFHRVPECWDGGVASQGPASSALRANGPVRVAFAAEALALWRPSAEQDHIEDVIALPLRAGDETYVLMLCSARTGSGSGVALDRVGATVQALLEDLEIVERQRLVARALEQAGNAAFITDEHGLFVWTNAAFRTLSGYTVADVKGRDPSLLHSGKQGVRYYRDLWSTIRSGNVWSGETVDRDKSGRLYTIRQTVSPLMQEGRVTHYVSMQEDIGAQKRRQEALELATGVDHITGLLTRAAFEARARDMLSTVASRQSGVELLLISLRGLRKISAGFDQEMSDYLATTMGRRVREAVSAPHEAANIAPFEYAVLIYDDQLGGSTVESLMEELQDRLSEPLLYLGDALQIDPRCVHASYPGSGASLEELWARADRLLADEPLARAQPVRPQ